MKIILNAEQRLIFDSVLEAFADENQGSQKAFCVNTFAGASKTFLFQMILHAVRGLRFTAFPVAWTGIAAVLLPG